MKNKLLLIGFLLALSTLLYAAWSVSTTVVWEFENNVNDSSGNGYALTPIGTPPLFDSSIKKYGSYSVKDMNATRGLVVPEGVVSSLSTTAEGFSIQFWVYHNRDSEPVGTDDGAIIGRDPSGNSKALFYIRFGGTNAGVAGFNVRWGDSWYGTYTTGYNSNTEVETWLFYSVEYDKSDTIVRIYKNSNLIYASAAGAKNPFSEIGGSTYIGYAPAIGNYLDFANLDNFQIVADVMGGVENTELTITPTETDVYTNTPTYTPTVTATPTITTTSTVTPTNTPGWSISQSAFPSSVNSGDTVTFRLSFTTTGNWTALEIRDQYAGLSTSYFTYIRSTPTPSAVFPNGKRFIYGAKPSGFVSTIDLLTTVLKVNPSDTYATNRMYILDGADMRQVLDYNVPFNTATVTLTRTATVTKTATRTVTQTRTETATKTVTPTAQDTGTVTQTVTQTSTKTVTQTVTETATKTVTKTRTVTPTFTVTSTITSTITASPTNTTRETRTPTFTITGTPPTATVTKTVTPTSTQTASPTSTFTITETHTVTPTFTITPTINLTPHYYYSSLDTLIPPETITLTSSDGTIIIETNYDVPSDPLVQFRSGPTNAYEASINTQTGYAIIQVIDAEGVTVDCSSIPCRVDLIILRHNTNFPWWP